MNVSDKLGLPLTAVLSLFFGTAVAQDAVEEDDLDDATNVWIVVEAQWAAEEKGDDDWVERMLADGFYGWEKQAPAPRSKSSTEMWNRVGDQLGTTVAHELHPLEIVIHGDTAIVHYLYASAFKDSDGKIEMNKGRYTDILVRTEDGWKFLGWHGGED